MKAICQESYSKNYTTGVNGGGGLGGLNPPPPPWAAK